MDQPVERRHCVAGQVHSPVSQRLECVDGRIHRPVWIVVAVDQDRFMDSKLRPQEFRAVRQRASVSRVGREDVHQHVVVELAVVTHDPKHLDFYRPLPVRRTAQTHITCLAGVVSVGDAKLVGGIALRINVGEVSHNQFDRLRLGVRPDPRPVGSTRAGTRCNRRQRIDRVDRLREGRHKIP